MYGRLIFQHMNSGDAVKWGWGHSRQPEGTQSTRGYTANQRVHSQPEGAPSKFLEAFCLHAPSLPL